MEDKQIVKLYLERSEDALKETQNKYNRYAIFIANNILNNIEDAKDCVNCAYLKMWDSIPPHKPEKLSTYLGKIVRNLALDMYDRTMAKKRGSGQVTLALDELSECVSSKDVENEIDEIVLKDAINEYLKGLSKENRIIFVKRYWYLYDIKKIAIECHISESNVKMRLKKSRDELREYLKKEGLYE